MTTEIYSFFYTIFGLVLIAFIPTMVMLWMTRMVAKSSRKTVRAFRR